jgi:hypothetical protein
MKAYKTVTNKRGQSFLVYTEYEPTRDQRIERMVLSFTFNAALVRSGESTKLAARIAKAVSDAVGSLAKEVTVDWEYEFDR